MSHNIKYMPLESGKLIQAVARMIREKEASELLQRLQNELVDEQKAMDNEINERNQVIQQLKDTIQEINTITTSEQKYIKKETKAHESSVKQRYQRKENDLLEHKNTLLMKVKLERKAHDKIIDFLSKQRLALDHQIQDWMTKYEEDTERKINELESLKQKRAADLDRFEELVAKYEDLERIVEEQKQEKAREEERRQLEAAQLAAAIRTQRWWRRCLAKKASSKDASKRKGSGKGKKGGTGKKGKKW